MWCLSRHTQYPACQVTGALYVRSTSVTRYSVTCWSVEFNFTSSQCSRAAWIFGVSREINPGGDTRMLCISTTIDAIHLLYATSPYITFQQLMRQYPKHASLASHWEQSQCSTTATVLNNSHSNLPSLAAVAYTFCLSYDHAKKN